LRNQEIPSRFRRSCYSRGRLNAELTRAEEMVSALRSSINVWSRQDDEAAERMLAYLRNYDVGEGGEESEESVEIFHSDVVDFFRHYEQSLDWVLLRDPRVMICSNAARSSEIMKRNVLPFAAPDAELIALGHQYEALLDE
jgi:hypothetical protein